MKALNIFLFNLFIIGCLYGQDCLNLHFTPPDKIPDEYGFIISDKVCYDDEHEIDSILNLINNDNVAYTVSNIGCYIYPQFQSKGIVYKITRIPINMVEKLLPLLDDPEHDWAANIMLYGLTQEWDCTYFGYFWASVSSIGYRPEEKWHEDGKRDEDIKKWKNYQW